MHLLCLSFAALAALTSGGTALAGTHADITAATVIAAGRKPLLYGPGQRSCGQWTESRKTVNIDSQIAEAWVTGFVSAAELWTNHTYMVTDGPGMYGQIDAYCARAPLASLSVAALDLVDRLVIPDKPIQ